LKTFSSNCLIWRRTFSFFVSEELQTTNTTQDRTSMVPAERAVAAKRFRRPLPEHLPREVHTHMPDHDACPGCGGKLRELGDDVAEILEYVRACFKVIRKRRRWAVSRKQWRRVSANRYSSPWSRRFRPPEGIFMKSLKEPISEMMPQSGSHGLPTLQWKRSAEP